MDLVCPAGTLPALKAAIDNGADAVYIGAARFGARAAAGGRLQLLCALPHCRSLLVGELLRILHRGLLPLA